VNLDVERLLDLAAQLPAGRRADFLAQECPDPLVRAEVESLLRYATGAEFYFEEAVQSVAHSLQVHRETSPGDVIGAYRVVSLLGRGGMGSVYLAERADGEIQKKVAVKLLRADGHRPIWRHRFLKERQLLSSLHHSSIVQLLDAGQTADRQPFLVMEYVEGVPIDVYAARIDVRARLKLFLRACDGVSHAHRHLIIHRDLKPSNILVDASGQPKLLDFGIAKLLDETGDATQTVERLLTPNYASPEQLIGEAQSTATDVYSLGAVLYKLLTGMAPREQNPAAPKAEIAPPSRLNPDVPRDVDFIVRKALRSEPEDRYSSVDEFANDVRAAIYWRPVQARSGDVWYRARRFLRRYWVPVGAMVLVIASLLTGLCIANWQRVIAERRFAQLRQLANKVVDLDRAIRILPGSTEARRHLVAASLEYLEGLSRETRQNLDLAQEIGDGYWRMARIQGVNAEFNLGDPAKAEVSLKKADTLFDTVLAARPQDRGALFRSALVAHDRMILADTDERYGDALAHASRAVERLETLMLHDDPRNPVRLDGFLRPGDAAQSERSGVALLYVNVALTHVNRHRYADGVRYARRAADLAQPIPSAQDLASGALSILANALRYQGDLDAALNTIREARRISENATYPSETARLFNRYGPILREGLILGEEGAINLDRPAEAIEAFQKALDMTEEAATKDLSDAASRSRVGSTARELGDVLRDRDPRRSLAVYDLGIQRLEETRNRLESRRDRAVLLAKSSYPLRLLHRASEARNRIDAAFAILKDTKDYPAERITLGSHVYTALCALADHEAESGDPRHALEIYRQLLDRVMTTNPDVFSDLRDAPKLSRIYTTLGVLYHRTGDAVSAEVINARRLELWRSWHQKLPQNPFIRRQFEAALLPYPVHVPQTGD
jgi:tetratricopeptide (TPR) repeat protein/tRNA A-37 threonylcarbamoyl transferase component Bud32